MSRFSFQLTEADVVGSNSEEKPKDEKPKDEKPKPKESTDG